MFSKLSASLVLALSAASAFAGSSYSAAQDNGSVISYSVTPRVLVYPDTRNGITAEGIILICPNNALSGYDADRQCLDKKTKTNAWLELTAQAPSGFTLSHYEFRFGGSTGNYRTLVAYFAPIPAPAAAASAVAPSKQTVTINAATINVTSDKVYVKRKK